MRKIKGVGTLKTQLYKRGKTRHGFRRYVHTNGVLSGIEACEEIDFESGTVERLIDEIQRVVRAGYEIRLGSDKDNCIRFYPLLDTSCKKFELRAQTLGDVKTCLEGMKVIRVSNGGDEIDDDAVDEFVKEQNDAYGAYQSSLIAVTPDTVVKCPKCGANIRVGKALANSR